MKVPFNDLSIQWCAIADEVRPDFERVFEQSAFCLGPFCDQFEAEAAAWFGVKHAIGVNSGTSALHLAAIAAGLERGDEILVPAHTFIATLWAVLYIGAVPVLCDVDAQTGTIDVADARRRVNVRTRAVMPVHLYGQPADMDAVAALAADHGLTVIEDAAQAIGALWRGRKVGTIGSLGCTSFYPGKNLGAAGEAGLVVTDDDALASRIRSLRNHGQSRRYLHDEIGYNYRLDGLQAVVLRHKLTKLDVWTAERKALAQHYSEALAGLPLRLPALLHQDHVWHLYVVRSPQRDALVAALGRAGVETGLHYPIPMHRQPCMEPFVNGDRYPNAEAWADECVSLPLYVGMSRSQQDHVIATIKEFFVTEEDNTSPCQSGRSRR